MNRTGSGRCIKYIVYNINTLLNQLFQLLVTMRGRRARRPFFFEHVVAHRFVGAVMEPVTHVLNEWESADFIRWYITLLKDIIMISYLSIHLTIAFISLFVLDSAFLTPCCHFRSVFWWQVVSGCLCTGILGMAFFWVAFLAAVYGCSEYLPESQTQLSLKESHFLINLIWEVDPGGPCTVSLELI